MGRGSGMGILHKADCPTFETGQLSMVQQPNFHGIDSSNVNAKQLSDTFLTEDIHRKEERICYIQASHGYSSTQAQVLYTTEPRSVARPSGRRLAITPKQATFWG